MANKKIMLGDFELGSNEVPYFIAEIGINHNGDMQVAKRLMDAAFAIGWNCVKFQKRELPYYLNIPLLGIFLKITKILI